jgi:two-component system phosphate regulon sensor histidine kinase PhoR
MLDFVLMGMLLVCAGWLVFLYRQHQSELRVQEKKNQRVRREASRERDELLDALGDAFLLVSETSQIVFANACARTLVKGRKLMGQSIMEAFLDDRLSVAIMKCIRTKQPMQERVVLHSSYTPLGKAGDESVSAWEIDAAPLSEYKNQGGCQEVTRVVIRDVTAEYLADQVRRDFVANASHELRTPMSIINGYLENLLDDNVLEDPVTARKFLETMRKHGQRISSLVEDMLLISKMESGDALALNRETFSLLDCVQDVFDRLESMILKQSAQVKVEVTPSDLKLIGDRFYWVQVIFNLVENALKQNPDSEVQVVVQAKRKKGKIIISVCDNGVGIPSADLPYVFKRFYRVQKHHNQSEIKGTGLGLSIVSRAVQAHGGEIEVTSIPGQETCFTMTLPDSDGKI